MKGLFDAVTTLRNVAAVATTLFLVGCGKPPILTVTEPPNNHSIKAKTITIKGTVTPPESTVLISGTSVTTDKNGNFVGQAQLPHEGINRVSLLANNGYEDATIDITVIRVLTDEEKAAEAKVAAERAAADARAKAQEQAKEVAFLRSRAGKLCAKHPDWSRDDCQRVADHRIWVGMTLEMLKANRGLPDHANPSNYGKETSWQWCWDNYPPSCFYGGDDGVTTAYN